MLLSVFNIVTSQMFLLCGFLLLPLQKPFKFKAFCLLPKRLLFQRLLIFTSFYKLVVNMFTCLEEPNLYSEIMLVVLFIWKNAILVHYLRPN